MTFDAVAVALTAYGYELEAEGAAQVGSSFTGDPAADEFLTAHPNAFLVGVLFTQGIPAERAWAAPWLLAGRLGHFDVDRLADRPEEVRDAIQRYPMLHRFKNTLPGWVSSAARRLRAEYASDASNIWPYGSSMTEVTERLSAFEGIGRKKAVMTVQILKRHLGVNLVAPENGQVAYDVHVRRVFLRSGLAESDSIEAIERAAIAACPDSPGTLDLAAWLIGRQTCRPRNPLCDECRLGTVCPRRTWFAPAGVGSQRARRRS